MILHICPIIASIFNIRVDTEGTAMPKAPRSLQACQEWYVSRLCPNRAPLFTK